MRSEMNIRRFLELPLAFAAAALAAAVLMMGCGGGSSSAPAPVQPPATQAAQLKIVTPSLPAGSFEKFYQTQFKASGGFPPYQWFPASGDPLASGLTLDMNTGVLNGVLSGNLDF